MKSKDPPASLSYPKKNSCEVSQCSLSTAFHSSGRFLSHPTTKSIPPSLAQLTLRITKSIIRFFALILSTLVGTWRPPLWLCWITTKTADILTKWPRLWASLAVAAILIGFGLQQWQRWWEMHHPQERQLVAKRELTWKIDPPLTARWYDGKPKYGELKITFNDAAAPLEKIEQVVTDTVKIQPTIPGTWKWSNDRTLVFSPDKEWQAGQTYQLHLNKSAFPTEASLTDHVSDFKTDPLKLQLQSYNFYTQPDRPEVHQLTATITSNYALTQEALEAKIALEPLAEKPEAFGSTPPTFTLTASNSPAEWYFRSSRVKVPTESEEVKLTLSRGLRGINGGQALNHDVVAKAIIPNKYSALQVSNSDARIIKNDQGEPKQFLNFTTTLGISPTELEKKTHLFRLTKSDDDLLRYQKKSVNDVTEEMLARAKKIPLERVQQEEDSPYPSAHSYQFFSPEPGRLFFRADSGIIALGGFELRNTYHQFLSVPSYPVELDWTGKGNILALQGERTVQFKSRGVEYIQVTCGRVRASEVNHLVTQNDYGDFSDPSLDGQFSKDSIVRSQTFIIRVDKKNDWDASFTAFDLNRAMLHADPSDTESSRGLFFIEAEVVIPSQTVKDDGTSVHSRVEEVEREWEWEYQQDSFYDIDESKVTRTLLNSDGTVAQANSWFSDLEPHHNLIWGSRYLRARRFVMLTDLGLLVKANSDVSRDVFVMSLRGQAAVTGAKVTLLSRNGSTLAEGITDAQGRAQLPKPLVTAREKQAVAVVVRYGADISYIPLRPGQLPAIDYSRYDVDGVLSSRTRAVEAHVFTERGIYRPGDDVHFAAIVKRRDWQSVIEGLPVKAILRDSEGRNIASKNFKLPADGLVEGTLATSENHPTGTYELSLWVTDNNSNHDRFLLGRTALRIEDFRPDRMKMKVDFDPSLPKGWVKPEDLVAKISLENLFGAAAGERRVTGEITLQPAEFRFAPWKDYRFHNNSLAASRSIAGDTVALGEVKTSPEGKTELSLGLSNLSKVNLSVSLQLEAFESDGGHGVREHKSFLVSPWDHVAGYQSDADLDYLGKDSGGKVKFIAVDQDLQAKAVEGLRYRISETKYVSVLRQQNNGNMSYESQERTVPVSEEKNINWQAGPNEVSVDTSKVGLFTWQVINESDDVICEFSYRVVGKGQQDRSLEREAELSLTVSQSQVQAGSEVEVSIVAPYAGAGLITLEREKVLHAQWFVADTNATVQRVKIPPDMEGTVYCNVSFVRSLDSPDILMTPLSYATHPLKILPENRKIQVELSVPHEVRPGTEMKINYRSDKASRVILYAVDEGIHQITRYKRPEPLDFFFRKQALEVRTQQWFDLLLPEYRFLKQNAAFGGDGGGELDALTMTLNPFKRKRDAPVVWWSGIQISGPESKELTYKVPDYFAGTLTVMAVAVSETRAGSAQAATLVRSPLVLTPNTPTTVTPGDEFVVSVTVTNLLEAEGPADVGLRLETSPNLQIIGEAVASLTVEKSREATQRFRVKALDSLGSASLRFHAASGSETSLRTETVSLRPATPFRTQVRSAFVRTKNHEQEVTRSLYDAYRRAEVVASPLPVVLALGMRDYMQSYPYDCTEQITSKGITLLSYRSMKSLPQSEQSTTETINRIIDQLRSRQSSSGGFGYWQGSTSESDDFLNVYVMHFLLEASDAGFAIPHTVIQRGKDKLKTICQSGDFRDLAMADRKAYAIYLLTRQGERPNGLLSLRETLDRTHKDQWQNRLCGTLLAATYKLQQNPKEAEAIVKTWELAKTSQYRKGENYWSQVEVDTLLSFAFRARHFPETVKNYGYADWQKLYGVLWQNRFNTITAACATLGMREFAQVAKENQFQFEINAVPRDGSAPFSLLKTQDVFARSAFAENLKALEFRLQQEDGDQGLFYQVVEEGFDRKLPTEPQKDGIEIHREITGMDGNPIESIAVGETLKVTLRVRNISNIPLGNLVMIDLLPGGFSLEPEGLKAGVGTVAGTERADLREDRNLFFFTLEGAKDLTVQYNLRATCAGEFAIPPLFAESMYDRGINGVGLGSRIKVTSRD